MDQVSQEIKEEKQEKKDENEEKESKEGSSLSIIQVTPIYKLKEKEMLRSSTFSGGNRFREIDEYILDVDAPSILICIGFGKCLRPITFNSFRRCMGCSCSYDCKPMECPKCNRLVPEWYFSCYNGTCGNCSFYTSRYSGNGKRKYHPKRKYPSRRKNLSNKKNVEKVI